jgi:hypothetical protein
MEKKVKPGKAYTKSGVKTISGSADTTALPSPTLRPSNRGFTKMRSNFEDQSGVGPVYRWTSGRFSR